MSRPLYEITADYRALLLEIDAADGVLEGDLETRLDAIAGELADKVESCVIVARSLEAEASVIREEERRLGARRAARERAAERLYEYARKAMRSTQTARVVTPRFTIALASNPPAVRYVEGAVVPPEWMRVIPEQRSADTQRIRAALLAGDDLSRFAVLERGERLSVR